MNSETDPKTVTLANMNGRIAEIEMQRDGALTRCAKLAGERAEAIDLVMVLRAEVERLEAVVKRQSALIPEEIDGAGSSDIGAGSQA